MKKADSKTLTCIVCPMGCKISLKILNEKILSVAGNKCPKGEKYARQELVDPRRSIASSVLVLDGELPLCSVRTSKTIPKGKISEVMNEVRNKTVTAPVQIGEVILRDVAKTGVDMISTKTVLRKNEIE